MGSLDQLAEVDLVTFISTRILQRLRCARMSVALTHQSSTQELSLGTRHGLNTGVSIRVDIRRK